MQPFKIIMSRCLDDPFKTISSAQMTPPKGIWLAITDQAVEGEWRDYFNNKVSSSSVSPTSTFIFFFTVLRLYFHCVRKWNMLARSPVVGQMGARGRTAPSKARLPNGSTGLALGEMATEVGIFTFSLVRLAFLHSGFVFLGLFTLGLFVLRCVYLRNSSSANFETSRALPSLRH